MRPWILGIVAVVGLTIWGYVSIGPNGRLVPGRIDQHRTDFTVFTEAGAAFFDGRNPYRVTSPRGWHYLYPPLFALFIAPLSAFDTESQVVIWYVVNVVLSFGCLAEARRLWRLVTAAVPQRPRLLAICASLTAIFPFLDCMQAGQLGIAILYMLLLGFRLVVQDRSLAKCFLGGLILGLPPVIKLVPGLPVGCLLIHRWLAVVWPRSGRKTWSQATALTFGVLTGVLLFLFVIPAFIIGWRANLNYLDQWRTRIVMNERVGPNANFNIHSYRNQSLANAIYLWDKATSHASVPDSGAKSSPDRPERVVHPAARVLVGLILVGLVVVGCRLGSRTDFLDQSTAYGLACCATLIVSPLSWGHYYMAEVPATLFVPLWFLRRGRPMLARIAAVIPMVLSWSYYVAQPYTGGLGLLGLGTTAWFVGVSTSILGVEVVAASNSRRLDLAGRRLRPDSSHDSAGASRPRIKATTARRRIRAKAEDIRTNNPPANRP
jgi:hypothetical protein